MFSNIDKICDPFLCYILNCTTNKFVTTNRSQKESIDSENTFFYIGMDFIIPCMNLLN